MTDNEVPLDGGNMNPGVFRAGDTVRRSAGSWTAGVHDLLRHLETRSFPAPRPLGIDDHGRERLTFIQGVPVHPDNLDMVNTDAAIRRVGKLIVAFHRAQADYQPPPNAAWRSEGRDPSGSSEVIAHNDLAPWNLIAGPTSWVFIDWDLAAPGRRLWDLAWAVQTFVGLWPDSALTFDETVGRIAAFCDGAEIDTTSRSHLLDVVVERTAHHSALLRSRAGEGDPTYRRLVEEGHADAWERGTEYVSDHRDSWSRALRS